MPWTKEEKREYYKKYNQKNREEKKEYMKKWKQNNRDKLKKNSKKWREKNKEYMKKWRENNREYEKKCYETEKGKKCRFIINWKQKGMICEDWDSLYEIYYYTWNCDYCNCEIDKSYNKHLDHDHNTGQIRAILCNSCNAKLPRQ